MEDFRTINYKLFFENLKDDSKPKWGKMSLQHAIEHLSDSLLISNGKNPLKMPEIPTQTFDHLRKFLLGKNQFPQGFISPLIGDDLPDLRNENLENAKNELVKEIENYMIFWSENPNAKFYNPTFGILNFKEWELFHNKHFRHHFNQFGLIDIL